MLLQCGLGYQQQGHWIFSNDQEFNYNIINDGCKAVDELMSVYCNSNGKPFFIYKKRNGILVSLRASKYRNKGAFKNQWKLFASPFSRLVSGADSWIRLTSTLYRSDEAWQEIEDRIQQKSVWNDKKSKFVWKHTIPFKVLPKGLLDKKLSGSLTREDSMRTFFAPTALLPIHEARNIDKAGWRDRHPKPSHPFKRYVGSIRQIRIATTGKSIDMETFTIEEHIDVIISVPVLSGIWNALIN